MVKYYDEADKLKYVRAFKNCNLTVLDYCNKMQIRYEDMKEWLKEYKNLPANELMEAYKKSQEEIIDGEQCTLFPEGDSPELEKAVKEEAAQLTVHKKKNAKKQTAGIKRSAMKDVKIVKREYRLEEDETHCDS